MALDKDVLGMALYDARDAFNNKTYQQLVDEYGTIENARIAACKADAEAIINHLTTHAIIPATGLVAPNGAVTGEAKIQ
jgi:hypothetical protein